MLTFVFITSLKNSLQISLIQDQSYKIERILWIIVKKVNIEAISLRILGKSLHLRSMSDQKTFCVWQVGHLESL